MRKVEKPDRSAKPAAHHHHHLLFFFFFFFFRFSSHPVSSAYSSSWFLRCDSLHEMDAKRAFQRGILQHQSAIRELQRVLMRDSRSTVLPGGCAAIPVCSPR